MCVYLCNEGFGGTDLPVIPFICDCYSAGIAAALDCVLQRFSARPTVRSGPPLLREISTTLY